MMSPELGAVLAQSFPPEALASLATPTSISMMKNGTIASVTAMQPVFAGGQIVNGNRLARVGEEASMLQLQLSENEVEKTVSQYYWQLMALNKKQKTIAAVETLLSDIYKDVDVAVRAGVALRNDLLQVQLRQNEVESKKVKLQNGISVMKLLLEQYCGLKATPEIVYPDVSGENLQLPTPPTGQGSVTPLPEYQLLQKQVEAAQLQKKMAVGQQLPSVAVGAGYNYHNLMENDRTFAMVFATVSVPISDWWGGSHAIKRKKIELQKAQDQLEDNAELLGIRIQKAWNDVNEAALQVDIARRSIEQAEENLRLNRNFYQAGTVKMSDLLEAQLLYQQACDQHVDAYANYQQQLLLYQQATGQKTSASR
jgi:outer membrane protein TolC